MRPIDRHNAPAASGHRRRRQVVAGLPMALVIALLILVGVQRVNERRAAAASYAAAERALAAGDLIGAQARFAAAGGYRDAEARVDEVVTLLATYRNAYGDATAAFNSGQYDLAIATLLPVLVALPNDIDSLALIETARGERRRALEREAALAEEIGDWYHAERALAALVRDDPDNAGYAQRLSDIRMNRAPFVYARNGTIYVGGAETYSDRAILTGYDAAWPVWSPDRARIAFVNSASSQRDLAGRLYVVDGDGS
ncbi:MAG: hypothetical protein IT336_15785, partial [Thermomicrobiales bacterium]|nr:hypothetical protein [Thermomicrobiales bacterium]